MGHLFVKWICWWFIFFPQCWVSHASILLTGGNRFFVCLQNYVFHKAPMISWRSTAIDPTERDPDRHWTQTWSLSFAHSSDHLSAWFWYACVVPPNFHHNLQTRSTKSRCFCFPGRWCGPWIGPMEIWIGDYLFKRLVEFNKEKVLGVSWLLIAFFNRLSRKTVNWNALTSNLVWFYLL